jgi:hypothetical protein
MNGYKTAISLIFDHCENENRHSASHVLPVGIVLQREKKVNSID